LARSAIALLSGLELTARVALPALTGTRIKRWGRGGCLSGGRVGSGRIRTARILGGRDRRGLLVAHGNLGACRKGPNPDAAEVLPRER
jgi:hypothetical protein